MFFWFSLFLGQIPWNSEHLRKVIRVYLRYLSHLFKVFIVIILLLPEYVSSKEKQRHVEHDSVINFFVLNK